LPGKAVDRSILQGECIEQFRAAIRSPATRDPYERRLIAFLKTVKMVPDEFVAKAKCQPSLIEKRIISFINEQNSRAEKGEITAGTVGNAIKAVRLLLEMNDVITLNWKKIRRVLPKARRYALDRIPTAEEIQDIIEAADIRGKALTLVFTSSGIREGAIEQLKVADYTRTNRIGRLTVYNGDPERYVTFISPDTCTALDKYLNFRREHGENISDDSPLFRDKFDPIKGLEGRGHHGHSRKDSKEVVIPMTAPSVRQYYNRLLFSIGIRNQKKRRHEFSVHSLRKVFKTRAEQAGMKPINVEILMGHSVGISDSYYRPTEGELLEDYLAIVDNMEARGGDIDAKISERDAEISTLSEQLAGLTTALYQAGILKKD
jgi:integrase